MTKNILYISVFFITFLGFSQEQLNVFDVARSGTVAEAEILLQKDKEAFNTFNKEGYAPLTLACYRGNIEVVKTILKNKCNINANSNMGTPLMAAVVKGNLEIVKLLIDNKADVNLPDANGTTPLIYATIFKNASIMELLIKQNADKTKKDKDGRTAFEFATINGDEKIIKLLK